VLSEVTTDYDRGGKFGHYRKFPSLAEFVIVDPTRPYAELWTRQEKDWRLAEFEDLSRTVQLASIGAALPLSEIYSKLDFADSAPAAPV
jgi:Uma2 family endonuclease